MKKKKRAPTPFLTERLRFRFFETVSEGGFLVSGVRNFSLLLNVSDVSFVSSHYLTFSLFRNSLPGLTPLPRGYASHCSAAVPASGFFSRAGESASLGQSSMFCDIPLLLKQLLLFSCHVSCTMRERGNLFSLWKSPAETGDYWVFCDFPSILH